MSGTQQKATSNEWASLVALIAAILVGMVDEDQQDKLFLEIGGEQGPYVQACGFDGNQILAEVSDVSFVDERYLRGGERQQIAAAGWNDPDPAHGPNPWQERPISDAAALAADVVGVLRDIFSTAHPDEIRIQAQGPHASVPATTGGFLVMGETDEAGYAALAARLQAEPVDDCGGTCQQFQPGHQVHPIQARHAAAAHAWEVAVTEIDGQSATFHYADAGTTETVWHHRPLEGLLTLGQSAYRRAPGILELPETDTVSRKVLCVRHVSGQTPAEREVA